MRARVGEEFIGLELSSGTLRSVDLINAMRSFLDEWIGSGEGTGIMAAEHYGEDTRSFETACADLLLRFVDRMDWEVFEDEARQLMSDYVVDLEEIMIDIAPHGTRYGAHEGDGASFGFWPIEEDD